jgi:outer membrane protein OmpA-like peptidoglycan-associated protein
MKNIFLIIVLFFTSQKSFSQEKFDIFFDFNIDTPNRESSINLENWILTHKNFKIIKFEGYCDSIDKSDYNKNLALRRIKEVSKILLKNNIQIDKKVIKKPFGKDFEQSKIQSENRKVTFHIQEIIDVEISLSKKIKKAKKGDLLSLKDLFFLNRSAVLVTKSKSVLEELLFVLRDYSKLKIDIQGHICCQLNGDFENISTKRAKAVYDFLILNEIDKKRLSYKGFGTTKPVFAIPEKNDAEANANRRVEIEIIEN